MDCEALDPGSMSGMTATEPGMTATGSAMTGNNEKLARNGSQPICHAGPDPASRKSGGHWIPDRVRDDSYRARDDGYRVRNDRWVGY